MKQVWDQVLYQVDGSGQTSGHETGKAIRSGIRSADQVLYQVEEQTR
jgi:hypothetical protein